MVLFELCKIRADLARSYPYDKQNGLAYSLIKLQTSRQSLEIAAGSILPE